METIHFGQDKHVFGQIYSWMKANELNRIKLAQLLAYQYHILFLLSEW